MTKIREQRQQAMARYVDKHHLSCFACGAHKPSAWGKTGWNRRGAWAICLNCARAYVPPRAESTSQ